MDVNALCLNYGRKWVEHWQDHPIMESFFLFLVVE